MQECCDSYQKLLVHNDHIIILQLFEHFLEKFYLVLLESFQIIPC